MPRLSASRGDENRTGFPSKRYSPRPAEDTRNDFDQGRFACAVVSQEAVHLAVARRSIETCSSAITVPKYLLMSRAARPHGVSLCHRACTARERSESVDEDRDQQHGAKNDWNQSASIPAKMMPCCTMPKISAPSTAPIADPYPPVSRSPPMTTAMMA